MQPWERMPPRRESLPKPRTRDYVVNLAHPLAFTIIAVALDVVSRWARGDDLRAVLYSELFFLVFGAGLFAHLAVTGVGGGEVRDRHGIVQYTLRRVRFGTRFRIVTATCACIVVVRLVMQLVVVARA